MMVMTVMNKKRRRKGARPESAKKKDWNWIELLQWGNSTLFGSCAAVQFCPGRRIRIIHRPLFGVLSLPRPFCRHVEQFKKETFVRLFFTATACSCLFAPVDSVCNYLFLPFSRSSVFCVFHRQMFVILSTHFLDFSTSPPLICSSLAEWNYFFEFSSRRLSHWHRSRSHRSQRIMEKVLHKFSLSTSDFLVVHQKKLKKFLSRAWCEISQVKIGCIHNTKAKIYIHVIINWRSNHFDTWHRFALVDFSFMSRSKFLSFPSSVFTGLGLSRNYWRRIDGYLIIMMIQKEMSGFLDSITAPFSVISFHFIPKPRRVVLSLQKNVYFKYKK